MTITNGGLAIATDELIAEVDGSLPVCSQFTLDDLDGWERFLAPEYDPENWGQRLEMQRRNDCRANGGSTCAEIVEYRSRGKKGELSRMFLYQQCELIDRKLGSDSGVSMQAGVKVMTEIGLPLESEYPYTQYTGRRDQLDRWVTPEILASAATRKIVKASIAPAWDVAVAHVALGHPLDLASYWPLSFESEDIGRGRTERVVRQYNGKHGGSGHAYAGSFVVRTPRGELLIKVHNSHNYFFYLSERAYEQIRDRRNNPFGVYQVAGAADPKKAYEGQFSSMGWS